MPRDSIASIFSNDGREGLFFRFTQAHTLNHVQDPNCLVVSCATFLLSILLDANRIDTKMANVSDEKLSREKGDMGTPQFYVGNNALCFTARCPIKLADHASVRVALYAYTPLFLFSRCSHISNSRMLILGPSRKEYLSRAEKATAGTHGGTAESSRRCG